MILDHVVLLVDIRIYIAVHAEELGVVCARINHVEAASDAGEARRSDLLGELAVVRVRL